MGLVRREKLKHQQAFELYYALGEGRSLSEVGRRIKTPVATVHRWGQAFEWQKRIREREKIVAEMVAEKVVEDEAASRALQLKICRAVQARFAEALSTNRATISTADFVKAAQHELLLRGKATARSEVSLQGASLDRLIEAIAAVIEREAPEACPACRAPLAIKEKLAAGLMGAAEGLSGNA